MNKLFTKIGVAMVGIAMAVGVGVAVGRDQAKEVKATDPKYTYTLSDVNWGTSVSPENAITWTKVTAFDNKYGDGDCVGSKNTAEAISSAAFVNFKSIQVNGQFNNGAIGSCSVYYSSTSNGTYTLLGTKSYTTAVSSKTTYSETFSLENPANVFLKIIVKSNNNTASKWVYLKTFAITCAETVVDDWELTTGSLTVSTEPTNKTYYRDDTNSNISKAGAVIKANYWSAADHSITKQVDISSSEDLSWSLDKANNKIDLSYTDGAKSQTGSFNVTVKDEDRPLAVEITYSGSTTNMDASNQADLFGLDEDVWDIKGIKNEASNNVGLNADGTIRLYGSSSGGNEYHIAVVDLDKMVISSFEFTLSSSYATGYKVYDASDTEITVTDDAGTVTTTKIKIKNVNNGTTQVRFESISVGWSYTTKFNDALVFENSYVKRSIEYPESTPTGVSGTACLPTSEEGGLGYYDTAITEYGKLSSDAKIMFATRAEFANARERMIAWAAANGKTLVFNADGSLGITAKSAGMLGSYVSNNYGGVIAIIVVATAISAIAIVGFVLTKKRKED